MERDPFYDDIPTTLREFPERLYSIVRRTVLVTEGRSEVNNAGTIETYTDERDGIEGGPLTTTPTLISPPVVEAPT